LGQALRENDIFDREVGNVLTKEIPGCEQGKTYYARIRAKNKAGLWSEYSRSSDGIMIDITPPSTPVVIDEGKETTESTTLSATFSSSDDESGIIEYQYAIGTSPNLRDILDWTSSQDKTQIEATELLLESGEIYYISVKARNGAGLWSEVGTSDGIAIAETPVIIEEETTAFEVAPLLPTASTAQLLCQPLPFLRDNRRRYIQARHKQNLQNR
jgi:hypothetical protein